jgi:hypothetical protein
MFNDHCIFASTAEEWAGLWAQQGGHPKKLPKVDFTKDVAVAVFRGVLASEKAVLRPVRELEDRTVITYTSTQALCGMEPHVTDILVVRIPRVVGKKWVVVHERRSRARAMRVETMEFPALP